MIYCLEDDSSIREMIVYTLQSYGMEARGFERPSAFWKAMESATPDLLLLDEPFKGLDAETRKETTKFVLDQMRGKTVIMVTHDQEDLAFCDNIFSMERAPVTHLTMEKIGRETIE